MTDKQATFIADLAARKVVNEGEAAVLANLDVVALTTPEASRIIAYLLTLPDKARERPASHAPSTPTATVREGRYALNTDAGTKFYRVDAPTEGRWRGYTFVKVQAGDEYWPVRGQAARDILAAIAADPDALARYGQLLGKCGHCGRTLTDEESRRLGIGPICRDKLA